MNTDYEIKFKFACKQESETLDKLLDRFIESVERANSFTGGGCRSRDGEFYIETSDDFTTKDLLTLLAVWLPHAKTLSVKAVAKETQSLGNKRAGRSMRTSKAARKGATGERSTARA